MTLRRPVLMIGLLIAVAVFAGLSLCAGKIWVPWSAWFENADDPRWAIIFQLRLPRTILAIAVGMALGISGAALQGFTRNSLADPGVLGVSSMAAFGAVMTLYLGKAAMAHWVLPLGGIVGAGVGVVILLLLAGGNSMVTFILAGIMLNTVAGAGVALALNLAPTPWAVNEIINWLLGSLADRSIDEVRFAVPLIIVGSGLLLLTVKPLDALTLGETGARSLGVSLERTRWLLAVGVGLAAGASVAVTGVIGFVGLITPHLLRPFIGERPGALLLPSAIVGALILLVADIIVRVVPSTVELRLGVAMAGIGGPFFFAVLINMRRKMA